MEIVVTASYGSEDESMSMLKDAIQDHRFEELLESIKVEYIEKISGTTASQNRSPKFFDFLYDCYLVTRR